MPTSRQRLLSGRVARTRESATLEVSARARALRERGVDVVDFGPGEPDFPSPPEAVDAAVAALRRGDTRYTAVSGLPDLRSLLARFHRERHGASWSGEHDCAITVGGKAALFQLALALCDDPRGAGHDTEVVIPVPAWPSFEEQVKLAGGCPVTVPMAPARAFAIEAEPLIAAITPRTRAVLINSPSNPTGGTIQQSEPERLAHACAERDVLLIADEAYERYSYDQRPHQSVATMAARFPDHCVLVGTFSKSFAMTGWRVGYLFAPPDVLRAVLRIQGHAVTHPTTFAMRGAVAALAGRLANPASDAAVQERFQARRDLIVRGLNGLPGVRCSPPAGAFYAFPDVSSLLTGEVGPGFADTVELATWLLEEAHVAVIPGSAFSDHEHIRLSFALAEERIHEGLERMHAVLAGRAVGATGGSA